MNTTSYTFQQASKITCRAQIDHVSLKRWIELFHKKEKRFPRLDDPVLDMDDAGNYYQVGDYKWRGINHYMTCHPDGKKLFSGMSLARFREIHKLDRKLTKTKITRLISLYHEKTGSYPLRETPDVWNKVKGKWQLVPHESWRKIDSAMMQGLRGLEKIKGTTLKQYKERNGFHDDEVITEKDLLRWLRMFKREEKYYPRISSPTIWDMDKAGRLFAVEGRTWDNIDRGMREGWADMRELGAGSLPQFIAKHVELGHLPPKTRRAHPVHYETPSP